MEDLVQTATQPKAKPIKTKSVIHPVKCSLEDLYNGKNFKIKVLRGYAFNSSADFEVVRQKIKKISATVSILL